MANQFKALGKKVTQPTKELESFETPTGMTGPITFRTNEFTSVCPITGQPDFSEVVVEYAPNARCLESKSFKLYLWSFREEGHFAEALAVMIANDIYFALEPKYVKVTINQAPRGGIGISATHIRWADLEAVS